MCVYKTRQSIGGGITEESNVMFYLSSSFVSVEASTATPIATDEMTTPDAISSKESVVLKRYPRQAVAGPTNAAVAAPTQLPIQKSNVVAERVRLMTQAENNQGKKMSVNGSSSPAMPTVSNIVTLYKVNGEAFESCDIANSQRIGQVKSQDPESHTGVITLPPGLLSIADNFFLGNNRKPFYT